MTQLNPAMHYEDAIFSRRAQDLMIRGNILIGSATPSSLVSDLLVRLTGSEHKIGEKSVDTENTMALLYDYLRRGVCILGSPLLTNIAARRGTLASCTAVPLNAAILNDSSFNLAEDYYNLNMGSGYDLTSAPDPVQALRALNAHASEIENSGSCERYVGNIAHISVRHPRIREFIAAKIEHEGIIHFNTSVDVSEAFVSAVFKDDEFESLDGTWSLARKLWDDIVRCAWECGDPGIVSLERLNSGNSLASKSPYVTMAPCAEVGLASGETCVFGYVNIAACLKPGSMDVDLDLVGDVADCLTRVLDDALESSIPSFPTQISRTTMNSNRKIGIGICGYADTLMWIGLDYGSQESCELLAAVLSTLNYRSKLASVTLARRRGAFPLFPVSRFVSEKGFLTRFAEHSIGVDANDWRELEAEAVKYGLRNSMTTALPPSGRSALILGVSPSLEPFLTLRSENGYALPLSVRITEGLVKKDCRDELTIDKSVESKWPRCAISDKSLFRTATDISFAEHLRTLEVAAKLVDDGISKTINMPVTSTEEDVDSIFTQAWRSGLKAISVYRSKA